MSYTINILFSKPFRQQKYEYVHLIALTRYNTLLMVRIIISYIYYVPRKPCLDDKRNKMVVNGLCMTYVAK